MAIGHPPGDQPRNTPPLQGKLVRLRPIEETDLARLNELFNEPDVLAGLACVVFPQTTQGIRDWVARTRSSDDLTLVIETLQGREAIGVCGLEGIDRRAGRAEFGIWIGKPYWGRGYGADATRTICSFGFRHMNLHRIELHTYPETNPRALRTYEKVGFKLEGTLREAHFLGGRYIDVAVMGLLPNDLID